MDNPEGPDVTKRLAALNNDEIAAALGISPVTVQGDLKAARIWLLHQLRSGANSPTAAASGSTP